MQRRFCFTVRCTRTLLNILIPLLSRVDDMLFCGVKMTFMGTKGYGQKRTPPKRCMGRVLVVRFFYLWSTPFMCRMRSSTLLE